MEDNSSSPAPVGNPTQGMQSQQQAVQAEHKTDSMGIISIVLAFVGMQIPGLVVGIIGIKQAKKEARPNTLSLVGVVLNTIFMLIAIPILIFLVLITFQGVQTIARDTEAKEDINAIHQELEKGFNTNFSYPSEISTETLPGIDPEALIDAKENEYEYIPSGCSDSGCQLYQLRYKLEETGNYYTRTSLN